MARAYDKLHRVTTKNTNCRQETLNCLLSISCCLDTTPWKKGSVSAAHDCMTASIMVRALDCQRCGQSLSRDDPDLAIRSKDQIGFVIFSVPPRLAASTVAPEQTRRELRGFSQVGMSAAKSRLTSS